MPPALIAALPLIISGVGTGITAFEALKGGPSAPKPADTSVEDAKVKAQQSQEEKAAIARQAPDIQTQLGGSVAPDYYADLAAKNAGFAGDTNQAHAALSNFFGGAEGGVTSPQGAPPGGAGGKGIFESLISQNFGDEDKGASGGFTGV